MRDPFMKFRIDSNAMDHEEKIAHASITFNLWAISIILED
jgi:hypothetical protein